MQNSVFATAKQVPAYTIALTAGLPLRRKGPRYWTCCPFHNEKTASLCFFENGSFFCFGCGMGGDSISFTASLFGLSPLDAARKINGKYAPAARPHVLNVYEWRNQQIRLLREAIEEAEEYLRKPCWTIEHADEAWNNPLFVAAIHARETAQRKLEVLQDATSEEELRNLRREAEHERAGKLRHIEAAG